MKKRKGLHVRTVLGTVFLAGLLAVQEVGATPSIVVSYSRFDTVLTEAQKVERLLNYIRALEGAAFIRNGREHSPDEAADHLQAKWTKHRSKVRTARNFVLKLASESGMTGLDYKIKFRDGTIVPTRKVLLKELKRLEQLEQQ